MSRPVSQRNFTAGLSATESLWSQRPKTIPRVSNLLLNTRGALRSADGSLIISELNSTIFTNEGPWTEISLFQPVNVGRYYIGIKKATNKTLTIPVGLAVADGGAGGTLANATYRYEVTALDGVGGETQASTEVAFANPGAHKANVSWTAVTNATGYKVYRTAAGGGAGTEVFLAQVNTNSFVDDGSITPGTAQPPSFNNTQQCVFYRIPATSYGDANILELLPADFIVSQDGTPGGGGGGGGGTGGGGGGSVPPSSGAPPTSQGGVVGNISPLPQIIQFVNFAILALGNGFAPQTFTDPSTVATITNTFVAAYPDWAAAITFAVGDIIMPTAANAGNFVFKCVQSGTTGAAHPTWPQTANQQVQETAQKLIWVNTGSTNTTPAPRGAAHAVVYAGSLWVANTSPTTTTDNFDGPSVLKMSDVNNPKSWNPLNTAFLGRDDGDQIMALTTFSIAAQGISPTGSLVAFKNFRTYQIIGVFGSSNFSIQEAQTDMGCIASRSVQFLPGFGIARLTHLGIAIFDGVNDRLISEPIRPYLFGGISDIQAMDWNFAYFAKGAQSANPPMYMLAIPLALPAITGVTMSIVNAGGTLPAQQNIYFQVTKLTAAGEVAISPPFLLNTGATANPALQVTIPADPTATGFRVYQAITSVQFASYATVTSGTTTLTSFASFPTGGTPAVGIGGLTRILCYDLVLKAWTIIDLPWPISVLKQVRAPGTIPITITGAFADATVRRLQSGDPTFDGSPVNWNMRTNEVFGKQADERLYFRRLSIRGTTTQTTLALNASTSIEGSSTTTLIPFIVYMQGSSSGQSEWLAQVDLNYNAMNSHVTISGSGQVEVHALDWEVVPMPAGVPVVIP